MALQPVQWIMYFLFLKRHLALDTIFIYISDQTAAIKMWGREKGACHPLTIDFNCEEEFEGETNPHKLELYISRIMQMT